MLGCVGDGELLVVVFLVVSRSLFPALILYKLKQLHKPSRDFTGGAMPLMSHPTRRLSQGLPL